MELLAGARGGQHLNRLSVRCRVWAGAGDAPGRFWQDLRGLLARAATSGEVTTYRLGVRHTSMPTRHRAAFALFAPLTASKTKEGQASQAAADNFHACATPPACSFLGTRCLGPLAATK